MTKMTYVSAINDVLNGVALTDEHVDKLTKLKESLEKRATGERKPTATQKANVEVKANIAEFIKGGQAYSATEIGNAVGISNQKASALLGQMVKAGEVTKFSEKRKTFFKVAE